MIDGRSSVLPFFFCRQQLSALGLQPSAKTPIDFEGTELIAECWWRMTDR